MLTNQFYAVLAAALRGAARPPAFFVAVGSGERGWDLSGPPPGTREVRSLAAEVARRAVPPERIEFLDAGGRPGAGPTPRLRLSVEFPAGEATGTLRECGLFAGSAEGDGPGTLLSYFAHARIDKEAETALARSFVLDLRPAALAAGSRETRWLANTRNEEVHDLERRTPRCQVEEIRFDRRFYFPSAEAALEAGYDRCAYCFGRDLSER